MVADDQLGLSAALLRFLDTKYRCLPLVSWLDALEPAMRNSPPDVLFLDVVFQNDESSLPRLRGLTEKFPDTGIIIHTGFPERAPVAKVLADGARGYLIKDEGPRLTEFSFAIDTVLRGEIYLCASARARLEAIQSGRDEAAHDWEADMAHFIAHSGFSVPLAEVSLLHHQDMSDKRVAATLQLSLHPVLGRFRRIREHHGLDSGALMLFVERTLGRGRHRL